MLLFSDPGTYKARDATSIGLRGGRWSLAGQSTTPLRSLCCSLLPPRGAALSPAVRPLQSAQPSVTVTTQGTRPQNLGRSRRCGSRVIPSVHATALLQVVAGICLMGVSKHLEPPAQPLCRSATSLALPGAQPGQPTADARTHVLPFRDSLPSQHLVPLGPLEAHFAEDGSRPSSAKGDTDTGTRCGGLCAACRFGVWFSATSKLRSCVCVCAITTHTYRAVGKADRRRVSSQRAMLPPWPPEAPSPSPMGVVHPWVW